MARCLGITESYWSSWSEDHRLYWKITSRAVGILAAFFASKSGNPYVDWALTALTAAFYLIVIDTQRSYSKLSPLLRKRCIRIAMALGTYGPAILGAMFFVQIALLSVAQVFAGDIAPGLTGNASMASKILLLGIFIVAAPIAVIRTFRQLHLAQLIYHLPRQALKKILVYKSIRTATFREFAEVELSILCACLLYPSIFSASVKLLIDMYQLVQ